LGLIWRVRRRRESYNVTFVTNKEVSNEQSKRFWRCCLRWWDSPL
jgi:hypothetical protein